MAGVEVLVRMWQDLGIQLLVLLSFALQVILLILAEVRRRKDSGMLRAAVWSAYLLADSTAIYVLGHMSVTSTSAEHQLMAFWAPFLLLHLGGQDNITAYAIEDNRLWLRHFQALAVQVLAAAYVLYESSIIGSQTLLWRAAILMFVPGVLKYGERIWALKCASAIQEPNKNYTAHKFVADELTVPMELQENDDLLWTAHFLLKVPKKFLSRSTGNISISFKVKVTYNWDGGGDGKDLFTLVEMQLSLMHDILYSKAEVMYTWYGLCIRIISSVSTAAALLLFHLSGQSDHGHSYSRVDVAVTYALLVGAIVLETTSLVRAIFSSWALVDKKFLRPVDSDSDREPGRRRCCLDFMRQLNLFSLLRPVLLRIRRLVLPERQRWWSETMGQHNLFELYERRKTSRSSRIARWLRVEDWWNTMVHSRRIPVSAKMKQLLVELLFVVEEEHAGFRARLTGMRKGVYTALGLSGSEMKLDESILVWHIATDVYLRWYRDNQQPSEDQKDLVEVIEALSNYMLFLLVARPYMLPDSASRAAYSELCYDLGVTSDISTEAFVRSLHAYGGALNKEILHDHLPAGKFDLPPCRGNTLQRGAQLGAKLIGEGLNNVAQEMDVSGDDWQLGSKSDEEVVALVWAKMLLDAGSSCGAYAHVKQLSNGGELLTVAALVVVHFAASNKWDQIVPW